MQIESLGERAAVPMENGTDESGLLRADALGSADCEEGLTGREAVGDD